MREKKSGSTETAEKIREVLARIGQILQAAGRVLALYGRGLAEDAAGVRDVAGKEGAKGAFREFMRRKRLSVSSVTAVVLAVLVIGMLASSPKQQADAGGKTPSAGAVSSTQGQSEESAVEASTEQAWADPGQITCIGDSVMLGAQTALQQALPGAAIDAQESRQVSAAFSIVDSAKSAGTLGDTVVIALGTNGVFDEEQGQELIDDIGSERHILWVLIYGRDLSWQEEINGKIEDLAKKNSNVHLADWVSAAAGHDEWFYSDGIHLNTDGQTGYAQFLQDALYPEGGVPAAAGSTAAAATSTEAAGTAQ